MIRLILERGGKQIHVKRINSRLCVEEVPGPIKEELMKTLCRDYKVDIDSS